tara:strand:+ start:484 stop:912 length:429 start_codon:yes stop_codon:yes gene_type:complete
VSAAFCLAVAVDTALYSTLRGNLAVLVSVNSDDIVDYVPKGSILVGNEEVGENGLLRVYYPVDGWVNTGDGSINVIAFKNANRQNSSSTLPLHKHMCELVLANKRGNRAFNAGEGVIGSCGFSHDQSTQDFGGSWMQVSLNT